MTHAPRIRPAPARRSFLCILTLSLGLLGAAAARLPAGPMDREQLYTIPETRSTIHPRLEPIMRQALQRPDEITRLEALAAIRRYEFTGLGDPVVAMLTASESTPLVRTAAARTALVLDAQQAAPPFLEMIRIDGQATAEQRAQALSADEALASWGNAAAVEVWSRRLREGSLSASLQQSAVEALGRTPGEDSAQTWRLLMSVVRASDRPISIRLAASASLARLSDQTPQTVEAARAMLDQGGDLAPLLAVRMLVGADSQPAVDLLKRLAESDEPVVQVAAMDRLFQINPPLLWPRASQTIEADEPRARLLTVRALQSRTRPESITLLAGALNDPHPEVRNEARRAIAALAGQPDLTDTAIQSLRDIIEQSIGEKNQTPAPHWRAAEQAALLLGTLDDKPSAPRLVELFDHPRPEVPVAAVDALRQLRVPATRRPLLDLLQSLLPRLRKIHSREGASQQQRDAKVAAYHAASELLATTAQTMGAWNVQEADATLRKLVPKSFPATGRSRASGVWALGLLHEGAGRSVQDLSKKLLSRSTDRSPLNPEAPPVRKQSLIALGRIGAESVADSLLGAYEQDGLTLVGAARWAYTKITGRPTPPLEAPRTVRREAFITPLNP